MIDQWEKRFEYIRLFGWVALLSIPCFATALFTTEFVRIFATVTAVLLILPAFVYTYVTVIWHWKNRYRGRHSDLWGTLILIETSGWMKIVYLFRHIIPDMRNTGRYHEESAQTD